MNLLLLTENDRVDGDTFRIRASDARFVHLRGVLQVEPGRTLRAGLVASTLGEARVIKVTDQAIEMELQWEAGSPAQPDIDVLLALPRPRLLKRLIPELTALGVRRVIFTSTVRVEKAYFGATALQPEAYEPLILDGLAQARRVHPLEIEIDRRFSRFLAERVPHEYATHDRITAHPTSHLDIAQARVSNRRAILAAIGPEGGFVDHEIDALEAAGFLSVSLGPNILRVETACVAFIAQIDLLRRQSRALDT